jgi:hypothetical protein
VGTGRLGPQQRVTVRLPQPLYDRLEAFSEGRRSASWSDSNLRLADVVRDAIAHYLACPQRHIRTEDE